MFYGAPLDESKKAKLAEALGFFDTVLKGNQWAAADQFTIGDLSLCVTVSQIEAFGFDLGPYPRVRAWFQKCKEELEPFGYQVYNVLYRIYLLGWFFIMFFFCCLRN